jgi:signal peptidase I
MVYNSNMDNQTENNEKQKVSNGKKAIAFALEIAKIAIIAAVIVIPIRYYLFQPFFVRGQSMDPNFENGDYLIVDEITYRFRAPERGEVIVFKFPFDTSQRFIKRVIGLPGETVDIKDGKITIYDDAGPVVLDESEYNIGQFSGDDINVRLAHNEYFVMGDNRDFSFDSRRFGPITEDYIIGRVILRAWPFDSLSTFVGPVY